MSQPQGPPPFPPPGPQGSDPWPQQVTAPLPAAPEQKPFLKRPWVWGVAAALVIGIGIGNANGGSEAADSIEAASTSSAAGSSSPTAPAESSSSPATAPTTVVPPAAVAPTQPPTTPPPAPATQPEVVVDFAMPDLVGVDLQTAQITVQSNGVFLSRSHDLLGSRNQLVDSNWMVCTQNVPAGQRVTGEVEGLIDLGVVKREETCP
ncbi:hypothetical protein [Geodermatophilus sabuli]|uniref:PASTA domain-containing protein n=1 Tax=Geodermatophilus sabuli TaxID=1564158 RepID=A0A285EI02_9ACTN|nr:hypothetical protein [Geodermatophilus sabuli]MBB3086707.1 hypothetical protein [Geodermatophilus sabuli]SNX97641.1 hypothetical protein SAMN06893097_1085 [Geodermatophilus sabuli]